MRSTHHRFSISFLFIITNLVAVIIGVTLGLTLAAVRNIQTQESPEHKTALPTQIYDIKKQLITEFFQEEKRNIVTLDEMPQHLINALITREDRKFYSHRGFSIIEYLKAIRDIIMGNAFRGGSTITLQLASLLYDDPTDISLGAKIRELWWAIQLEKKYSKDEILEKYLNEMYFGHNTYGVEAASQFYFNHSVRDITLAESVVLVIQLASPVLYSPLKKPENAKKMQK